MEVESLSDVDLRKMLMEHGVAAGPVTNSTRNVLQNKLCESFLFFIISNFYPFASA